MAKSIAASGVLGVALEPVSGTYVAPTKFVPFNSESLTVKNEVAKRRPIRNTPGLVGVMAGNTNTEGDLEMEALSDVIPYFLHASRCTVVKTGTGTPYTYKYTPSPVAVPTKTMSITIRRGTEVFGYAGCVVGGFTFSVGNEGILTFSPKILGTSETSAAALSAITWPTTLPFSAGNYALQVPTGTPVLDSDTYEFAVDDSPTAQFRLNSTTRNAQFISFGESSATVKLERDFEDRISYDKYKNTTSESITFTASKGPNESVTILTPVAFQESNEIKLGGQGDLVRASVNYDCAIDATGKHYEITVLCAESNVLG